jgi:hypothetical protein
MADPIDIAAIYGIEDVDGVPALVMELVEGSTLADRVLPTRSGERSAADCAEKDPTVQRGLAVRR